MKHGRSCTEIEIKAGSGLALAATITTMRDTTIETVVETSTESTDLTAAISTIIELAVA